MCGGSDPEIKETPEQKELARIAAERWNVYQEMYLPAEQQYFDHVDSLDSAGRMNLVEGAAGANVESAFGEAIAQDVMQMTAQGASPESGDFQMAVSDRSMEKAGARAENVTRSQQALEDGKVAGKQNIVAMGNNQSGQAIAGLTDIAQHSANEARGQAIDDFTVDQGNQQALGQVAGAGYGAYRNMEDRP